MNTIPNLDAMTETELCQFAAVRRTRASAARLVGDTRPGYTCIADALGHYAWNRLIAMRCRREGDLGVALRHEAECDRLYKGLPEDCRW